jgi:hypothetical protein
VSFLLPHLSIILIGCSTFWIIFPTIWIIQAISCLCFITSHCILIIKLNILPFFLPVSQALGFHIHFYFKHRYILLINIFIVKENYSLLSRSKFDALSKEHSKFSFIFFSEIRLQHLLGMNMTGPQQRSGSTLPSPGGWNSKTTICTGNSKDKVRTWLCLNKCSMGICFSMPLLP